MSTRKESMNPRKEAGAADTPAKKPYTTPCLTTYGSLEKLTKGTGATTKETRFSKKH